MMKLMKQIYAGSGRVSSVFALALLELAVETR